jgi:ABC-2 type transport system ATP-binding protein
VREVVVVDRVTKIYPNGVKANIEVSVRACSSEVVCIMGPNGAGKTTLVRQIIGLLKPTSGVIRVFGVDPVKRQDYIKKKVAYTPQLPLTYPAHRVLEVSKYVAELSNTPFEHVKEVLEELDLWSVRDRLGYQLSIGQRKLLLLALALIKSGDLLILDEPTTFVDIFKKRLMWSVLLEERKRGKTMIIVSHDIEEVRRLCDRVYIMVAGRIAGKLDSLSDISRGVEVKVYYEKPGEITHLFKRGVVKVYEGLLIAEYNQLIEALEDLENLAINGLNRDIRVLLEYPSVEYIVESLFNKR